MKVTAYIQHSNDPLENLVQFDASRLEIDGKNGTILLTTEVPITGLKDRVAPDRGENVYEFNIDDIVDFNMVDILHPDSANTEKRPYNKKPKPAFPAMASSPNPPKPKKPAKVVQPKPAKPDKKGEKLVILASKSPTVSVPEALPVKVELEKTSKEIAADVARLVSKKDIKTASFPLPVAYVLKALRDLSVISNRTSGTINAVAIKMGMTEDWHTFLELMTRTNWMEQENVAEGVMSSLEALYKKSFIEFKD